MIIRFRILKFLKSQIFLLEVTNMRSGKPVRKHLTFRFYRVNGSVNNPQHSSSEFINCRGDRIFVKTRGQ
jgi:hypothetical protein